MMRQVRIVVLIAVGVAALTAAAGADAAQIVFSSDRADGVRELYVVDRDGSGEHRITFNDYGSGSRSSRPTGAGSPSPGFGTARGTSIRPTPTAPTSSS